MNVPDIPCREFVDHLPPPAVGGAVDADRLPRLVEMVLAKQDVVAGSYRQRNRATSPGDLEREAQPAATELSAINAAPGQGDQVITAALELIHLSAQQSPRDSYPARPAEQQGHLQPAHRLPRPPTIL